MTFSNSWGADSILIDNNSNKFHFTSVGYVTLAYRISFYIKRFKRQKD